MKCKSGKHDWHEADDAGRCCNGWVEVWEPWGDGPDTVYEQALLPETQTKEIARLKSMRPIKREEVTSETPWLRWNN